MFQSSVVSYGKNGRDNRYGRSSYRGNTDGGIVHDFLDFCEIKYKNKVKSCSDYMSGSFTTEDVCKERGINGIFTDLSIGFNLLVNDIPDRPQTIFWHPPYSSVIGIPYAGSQWDDKEFINKFGYDPKPYDLGRMDWEKFVKALNYCCLKQFSALETGGRMGILMGDIRKKGKYYSMLLEIAKPGEVESIVIKRQNNTISGYKIYGKKNFIPIEQEYFLILRKDLPYILDFSFIQKVSLDIRNSKDATWKDVVLSVLEDIGKTASLNEIYEKIDGFEKAKKNAHWQEKVRQTLQLLQKNQLVKNVSRGQWVCVA